MLENGKHIPAPRQSASAAPEPAKSRELSWLTERVRRSRTAPFAEFATITPGIAKHILGNNPSNRKVNQTFIDQIVSDILNDRWDVNGEAIILSKDGEVNDGQHRLIAILTANRSVQTLVVFGVDRDSRFSVDMGRSRSVGDFLGMEGAKYQDCAASVARHLLLYRKKLYSTSGTNAPLFTKAAIRAEYWANEKAIGAALEATANTRIAVKVGRVPIAAAYVILHKTNKEAAAFFFAKLIHGDGLKQGDALLALRERLLASSDKRMKAVEKLEMILRHWNAWRKKEPMKVYRQTSAFPKLER